MGRLPGTPYDPRCMSPKPPPLHLRRVPTGRPGSAGAGEASSSPGRPGPPGWSRVLKTAALVLGTLALLASMVIAGLSSVGSGARAGVALLGGPGAPAAPAVLTESARLAPPPSAAANRFDSGWERQPAPGGAPLLVPRPGPHPPRLLVVHLGEEVERTLILALAPGAPPPAGPGAGVVGSGGGGGSGSGAGAVARGGSAGAVASGPGAGTVGSGSGAGAIGSGRVGVGGTSGSSGGAVAVAGGGGGGAGTAGRLRVRSGDRELASVPLAAAARELRIRLPADLPVGEVPLDLRFEPRQPYAPPAGGAGAPAPGAPRGLAITGATLTPALPPGGARIDGRDLVQDGNCLVYLPCRLSGDEALVGTFVPPAGARPGQRFELAVERLDGTPIRRFHWQPTFWNRLRGARRFELPLRGAEGEARVRLISRAGPAGGPAGRWRGLALASVRGEILAPGQGQ